MFAVILKGFLLSLSLCLDLGMVNTALINTGLRAGTRPAFLVGLGSCFGDLFYAVLSLCGLALLFSYTPVRWVLWIGGGAVLLWLSWRMGRAAWLAARQPGAAAGPATGVAAAAEWSARSELLRGLGMALASPTSLLWFAAVGGAIIAHSTDGSTWMNGLFLVGFFLGGLAWSSFLALLAGRGRQLLGQRLVLYCNAASALLFGYFAVSVIADGYHTLL